MSCIIKAKKVKMSQVFKDDKVIPVTLVKIIDQPADSNLKIGDILTISGVSKGRGFQGGVKRHGFHGGPKTHGQKNRHRAPGSIGSTAPQRVLPGRKMAGRMGGARITRKNLEIVETDKGNNVLFIKGSLPGRKGGNLKIKI